MAAPGGAGPIGPYPPGCEGDDAHEAYDKLRRRVLWSLPYGLYVVGSRHGDVHNAMTLNWATQVSFEPKLFGIGVEKPALTHQLIADGGVFSLCTVSREDRAVVRKFTKPVDTDLEARTMNGFGFHYRVTGAPVLDLAVAWLDCEVRDAVDAGGHTFYIGEVMEAGFTGDEDVEVLRMVDTRMNYGG
jgi:flavin reductase (DIM6/NTAB) family NADH-FMN oxidoreductase RutF